MRRTELVGELEEVFFAHDGPLKSLRSHGELLRVDAEVFHQLRLEAGGPFTIEAAHKGHALLARDLAPDAPSAGGIGAMLGVLVGYLSGGLLGRSMDRALGVVERRTARVPGPRLFAATLGALAGAIAGTIGTLPLLLHVRPALSVPIAAIATWFLGALGARIAAARCGDLFAAAGLSTRPLVRSEAFDARDGHLVDTSAIMDGRFAGLVRAGVLTGDLLVPRFVLDELQGFADGGPESPQARRARRGLESLDAFGQIGRAHV